MGSKESISMSYSIQKTSNWKTEFRGAWPYKIKIIETELFFTVNNGL